jgi:beta-lactamase regulating signal transducer with metallopeptidase domain
MSAFFWIVILKASVLLGVTASLQAVMYRRTSAAARHMAWTLAVVAVLLLPVLSLALPEWPVVIRTQSTKAVEALPVGDRVEVPADLDRASGSHNASAQLEPAVTTDKVSWPTTIAGLYAIGVLVMLIRWVMQRLKVRRLAREATHLPDEAWMHLLSECAEIMGIRRPIRLLLSREPNMPMAFGTCRPTMLIPVMADTWPPDRRRAVLCHELAHIARYDCLTQTLAFIACTMYWFHPAAWWAARCLRIERELACDDLVLNAGAQARDYAGHLLEIAYTLGGGRALAVAVSMARSGQLEGRMLAVLDGARNRTTPGSSTRVAAAMFAVVILVPTASATMGVLAVDRHAGYLEPAAAPLPAPPQAGPPQSTQAGTWEIRTTRTEGVVHLRLAELNSSSSTNIPIQRLEGLTPGHLTGAGGPVQFRVRRDAGTFSFEGVVRTGIGAGTFSFLPDANFPAELSKRGFTRPTALEQYQLARQDIGYAFLDELTKQGYAKPQTSDLVRAGQHGVNMDFVREMGVLGYRLGSLEPLITLRDHGVTPTFVRELAALGFKGLSADDLRRARDHGVSSEYVRAMRDAGYSSLTMEQLVNARDHGVSADYVRELADAGHLKLPLDQLVRARDHGVSSEYAREMRQLGYQLPIEELIRARDHGVTPGYVRELNGLGYDRVTMNDLVTLRDHGLTADRIRTANARAGTRLPLDMLKSFAAGGMR